MYAKKNVYDNINGTLLNRQYKIKDSVNARLDLVVIGIQEMKKYQFHKQFVKRFSTCLTKR